MRILRPLKAVTLCALALCLLSTAHAQPFIDDALNIDMITDGLEHPWSLAPLPNGSFLVTERPGRLRVLSQDGSISAPISGVPMVVAEGQGGLLDVALDPKFEDNNLIYLSYAEGDDKGDLAGTAVARATVNGAQLDNLSVIFRQTPKTDGRNHYGSRLVFARDGTLFITLGERFDEMKQAQNTANHLGKIVRINPDGTVPDDNPFIGQTGAKGEIWSYGHRNVQGAALNPITGELWTHEHGPRGGDEINIPKAGKNYGWPKASYGSHYWLTPIKDDHKGQGFEEPIHYWTPSIAPSGMAFYTHSAVPKWQNSLFVGALAKTHLARLTLNGNTVVSEEKLLETLDLRIRDVAVGHDGAVYVITDEDNGKLLRLTPKKQ